MAMKDFLPAGLKGLLLAAFFGAYMSTISTHLNWGTSYLVNDFYKRFVDAEASAQKLVNFSRIGTIAVMLIALAVTTQVGTISGVWAFIVECGAGLGLVLILRSYWWRINAWTEIVATITPFIGYALGKFVFVNFNPAWGESLLDDPRTFLFTVGLTTVAWLITTLVTQPTDNKKLQAFYNKIHPRGAWKPFTPADDLQNREFPALFTCWISGIVMAYSMLFLLGGIIFQQWVDTAIYLGVFALSLTILLLFSRKLNIFAD